MLFRFRITVLLSHTKVNNVDDIGCFRIWSTDQEVVRFDISVDQVLLVDGLNAGELSQELVMHRYLTPADTNHLLRNHDDRLDREFPVAVVEEIFQTWAQQIDDKNVV